MYFFRNLKVDYRENCALLRCYAASSGYLLPTFWDNLLVQSSGVKNQEFLTPEDGITATRPVITQKGAVPICFVAEACNNAFVTAVTQARQFALWSATLIKAHPPSLFLNRLTPNDPYMGRTTPLTPKRCILYIYSTNIDTEYFKHALYSPFFSLQSAVCFIILTCLVPVLFTFYIQCVLK